MDPLVREALLPEFLSEDQPSRLPFRSHHSKTPSLQPHRYAHRSLQLKRAERSTGIIIWRSALANLERFKEESWCFGPSCWVPLRKVCMPFEGGTLFWREERKRGALAFTMVTLGLSLSCCQPALAKGATSPNIYFAQSEHVVNDDAANLSPSEMLELQSLRVSQSAKHPGSNGDVILNMNGRREARDSVVNGQVPMTISADKAVTEISDRVSATGGERIAKVVVMPVSCPPSTLVNAAAVTSVTSAASIVGNPQQVVASLPGASQLLTRVLQHLGGGGFAGAVGATVVYPLDTIKTRLQAQSKNDRKYKNVLDCFRQLLLEEGFGSFYNGLVPQLLGIAPEKALKLTVNEVILAILEQHLPGARLWALEIIAGGGGGFSQVLVTNPMEIVKLRLQIQSKVTSPRGLWDMIRELGLRGLYNGSGITLARDVPSSAIFFACYTLITQMYPGQRFWAGFLAAIPATVLVTPLDVIKTRLQMETPPGQEPYKNALHCCRVLLQQEGLKGLFKGGLLRVLRTSPQFGITLMIYSLFCDGC